MAKWQLPLLVKIMAFSLDSHFIFETLVLLHKDLGNLENVIIVPWKEMFLKCEYWSSELSNVQIKPSDNFDLYQFAHSFNSANETH